MGLAGKKVLAVDDTDAIRTFLRIFMQSHGVEFFEAPTAGEGLEICMQKKPEVVILDLGLPDRDGLEILPEIVSSENHPSVIVLTVRKDLRYHNQAMELGAKAYLTKPFMMEELIDVIQQQFETKAA